MAKRDDMDRQIYDAEKERRSEERKKRWEKREKKFWRTFLFTEEGKPKSGFGIYTFCLSFVYLAFYMVGFQLVTEYLTEPMAAWPVKLANLCQALLAGAFGVALVGVLHKLLSDKRLALGGHLWLAVYAVAVLIYMLFALRGSGATGAFLTFYGWFVVIPLCLGLGASYLMYRRDWRPPQRPEEEPAWRKYTKRR